MINIPISSYPCSSDNISMAQNLGEKVGDINMQMQDVLNSDLPDSMKHRAIDKLENKKSALNSQINKKLSDAHYQKKLDQKRIENKEIKKQELETQEFKATRFDKKA